MKLFKSDVSQKSDRCPKCHGNLVVGCFKKVELETIDHRKEVLTKCFQCGKRYAYQKKAAGNGVGLEVLY